MMSRPPKASTAVWMKRSANPASLTLPAHSVARPPAAAIAAAVSLAGPSSRSLTTTAAPSPASLRAISAPMPRPAPVTIATLPYSLRLSVLSVQVDDGVAGHGDGPVGQGDSQLHGGQAVGDRDHPAGAGGLAVDGGDGGKADLPGPPPLLRP